MAHQVTWTEKVLNDFETKAMLSPEECFIMESRVKGWTITQQALYLHKSESSVHRTVKKLKRLYDAVQQEYPECFPERVTTRNNN